MSAPMIDPTRIERNWRAITAEIDAPAPSRIERALRRAGMPADITRVALATPSLRRAWFVALAVVMFLGLVAGDPSNGENLFGFLVVAPLVPLLGVSFAYGIESDPAHEIGLATPMRGLRLVLTRAVVVLAVSVATLGVAAVLNPARGWLSVAWVVPAIALTLVSLAASTWLTPRRAAAAVGVGWLLVLSVVRAAPAADLATFSIGGQVIAAFIAGGAALVVHQRRAHFDLLAVRL